MSTEPSQTQVILRRTEDGKRIVASVVIGNQRLVLDQKWLTATLEQAGLRGAVISKSGILQLQRMLSSNEAGETEIGECHDAEVGVQISEDKLTAKLILKTARAGQPTTSSHVHEVIEHAKLADHLVDHHAIERLLKAALSAPPGATLQIVVARGKAAVDGKNSPFEPLVEVSDRRPAERADGSLDYRDLGAIATVKEGDVLMRRHPPTKGVDGFTVNGTPIKAKDGRERAFKRYKGSAESPDDPNLLIATMTGQPVVQAAGVSVDPVLRVKDVNLRTGHIEYEGTLIVQGSVSPGMRLKVAGDVQILGMVESAELDVGGNLDVKMGISGPADDNRQAQGAMRVRCGGNLSAGHIENAELEVAGDVTIKSQLTHCRLISRNQVVVGSAGQPRSGIVGGQVQAASQIRAQSLGSQAGIATEIAIRCSTETLQALQEKNRIIEGRQADLGRLLKTMVELSKAKGSGAEDRLSHINQTCDAMKRDLAQITAERDQLQATVERSYQSCVEVPGTAFPRVAVIIGDQSKEVSHALEKVVFCFSDGKVRERPLERKDTKSKTG